MRRDTGRGRCRESRRFALVRHVGCVTGRASVMKEGSAPRPYSKHGGLCRWVLPLFLSLAFHAALFSLPTGRHVPEPRPVLRLTLTRPERVSTPAGPAGGGARKSEPHVERPAPPLSARRKPEPPRRKPETRAEPSAKPKIDPPAEALSEARLPRDFEPAGGPAVREPAADAGGLSSMGAKGGSLGGARDDGAEVGTDTSVGTGPETGPVDVETLRILSKTPPEYPLFSRKRREEGRLTILITIQSGRVIDARVEQGSGHPRLDEAALRAVRTWRFDHAGRIRARVPVRFQLKQ